MFKNYLITTYRNLFRNKINTIINITGLTVSIACCVFIYVFVRHEKTFDSFHANADRIVRVTMDYNSGDAVNKVATTGTKVGPEFTRSFPEVESYSRTLK